MKTIRIPENNDFTLYVPLVLLSATGEQPLDTASLNDVRVLYGVGTRLQLIAHTVIDQYIVVRFAAMRRQHFDLHIEFKNHGIVQSTHIEDAVEVVPWNEQSNWKDFIVGSPVYMPTQILISAKERTDEELEELKQEYRDKNAQLDSTIAEYQQKIQEIEGVAKETTVANGFASVLDAIGRIVIDFSPILAALENVRTAIGSAITSARDHIELLFSNGINSIIAAFNPVAKEQTLNTKSQEIKTAIAKGGGNPSKMAYEAMKQLQPYLYSIEYSELDYEAARKYFATHFVPVSGACTALRKGNLLGRNYDWTFDKQVEFLVRTKAHNGRLATIGVAGSISALTTDTIGEYSDEFKYMPFRMLDGMNEKGLTANVNMLNHDEQRSLPIEGTTPMIEERESICSAMLVRYVLDNFTTPQEACGYIRDYVRVYPPYHDGKTTDLHFSLTNKEQLYYLCFEPDNSGVFRTAIADVKDQPLPFVMTNFRMWWAQRIYDSETGKYDRFADPNYQYVEKYGMGIERANLCLQFVQDTETTQSVLDFMNIDLRYTEAYAPLGDWLTEFVGPYSQEDLARDSAPEEFERILGIVRQRYAERSRETALTWQTVHSVVYDLDTLTMQLVVQQGYDALEFGFVKSLPATKEDVQNVDLSNVAKQGNNPNVSLSSMDGKLGNMVVASQAEVTESLEYINSQLV